MKFIFDFFLVRPQILLKFSRVPLKAPTYGLKESIENTPVDLYWDLVFLP